MKSKTAPKRRTNEYFCPISVPSDYAWKVLGKLLLDLGEYLTVEESSRLSGIIRNRDLKAYLELSEDWGLQCNNLSGISVDKFRAKYLLASIIKKYQFPTDKKTRIAKAEEIFFQAEEKCAQFNHGGWKDLFCSEAESDKFLVDKARDFLVRLLGTELPGSKAMLDKARHGPGANLDTKSGYISTYHKYANWPYSCTLGASRYALFAIQVDRRWVGALQDDYRKKNNIPMHYPINIRAFRSSLLKPVEHNKIAFVPKDSQKERTIAIEPSLNLYLQLGVDGYMRKRLKRYGIDLDDQTVNQRLARTGSEALGKNFITLDLKSASDSISTKLVELLLPTDWYKHLMDLRSPKGLIGQKEVIFEKISSMGNGYTFALESALFAALVYAAYKAHGEKFERENFAVYGDDLIVLDTVKDTLIRLLTLCGFQLNVEKSFLNGPIRESCGADWYEGKLVRPIFLTDEPAKLQDLFCDRNRIKRLLDLYWGIQESKSVEFIDHLIPEKAKVFAGPYSDTDFDTYIHCCRPIKPYKHGCYRFRRIVTTVREQRGNSFHFRKLMHNLLGSTEPNRYDKMAQYSSGSRFTVFRRNAVTVTATWSTTELWWDEYNMFAAR